MNLKADHEELSNTVAGQTHGICFVIHGHRASRGLCHPACSCMSSEIHSCLVYTNLSQRAIRVNVKLPSSRHVSELMVGIQHLDHTAVVFLMPRLMYSLSRGLPVRTEVDVYASCLSPPPAACKYISVIIFCPTTAIPSPPLD